MAILFSHDEIMEMHDRSIRAEGRAEGIQLGEQRGRDETKLLYSELMKRLLPLGRIDELIDASSDDSKLSNLAKEFGLSI